MTQEQEYQQSKNSYMMAKVNVKNYTDKQNKNNIH